MKWPRITIKRVAWSLVAVLVLCALGLGALVASEWTFIQRIRHHPADSILNVAWYVPKESVPGIKGPLLAVDPAEAESRSAFAEAAKLAEAKNAAALLIIERDRVVLEEHWHGHGPGDWTNSASMAKTITALLVGIALGEGKIGSLDEPAAKWIPAWRSDARSRITLRHLLQMHSGLKPQGEYEDPFSDAR